jgi:hypothetical protein
MTSRHGYRSRRNARRPLSVRAAIECITRNIRYALGPADLNLSDVTVHKPHKAVVSLHPDGKL